MHGHAARHAPPPLSLLSRTGEFLQKGSKEQLRLLAEHELNTAVFEGYVEKENKSAISAAVDEKLRQASERSREDPRSGEIGRDRARSGEIGPEVGRQVRELLNGERAKGFDEGPDRKVRE